MMSKQPSDVMSSLSRQAIDILRANDRGGFTIPTANLYPYQWNWDSAFSALGLATFDRYRAWQELHTLFEGQWANGMVPHIIFRQNDPGYFPGPTIWQSGTNPASSGHSQPPLAASFAWHMVIHGNTQDSAQAESLFEKLRALHRWFHELRDPDDTGLVAITHPWESGRDNCPDWDQAMTRIPIPDDLEPYQRRDVDHIDSDQRPTKAQYDRYLSLIRFGPERQWDHEAIYRESPFLMVDPCIQFILMRADQDLLRLADHLGHTQAQDEITHWIKQSQQACQKLWNPHANSFCALDLRSDDHSDTITNAAMLAFYASAGTPEQHIVLANHARDILQKVTFGFPSWDPRHREFESQRYWRGPCWMMMNYLIAKGLLECGEEQLAARLRDDTIALINKSGFYEYYDPMSGEGLDGNAFSWTAAAYLAWSEPESQAS